MKLAIDRHAWAVFENAKSETCVLSLKVQKGEGGGGG